MEGDKREYFYRLIRLVLDVGTELLQKVFKSKAKPSIKTFVQSKKPKIEKLERRRILNPMQRSILNQYDETKLDISLLYILLRNLTDIQEPVKGWDECPLDSDVTAGAYLLRLKNVRNEALAHREKGSLEKSEFEQYWDETSKSLVELAGEIGSGEKLNVEQKVKEVKDQPLLGDENPPNFDALLKWEIEEMRSELGSKLDTLDGKVDQNGRVTDEILSSIKEIQDAMKKFEDSSTGTFSLVKPSPSTSVAPEQDIKVGQLKQIIEQMQGRLEQYMSQMCVMEETPINNPNALTGDKIIEYSSELGNDWEIFAIHLGYKQSQIEKLKDTYHRQIENLLRTMIQKWHDVVARCDENPKELLAAAFIRNRDNRTAEKILGNRERLTEVRKLKPKHETAERIHKITFGGFPGITYNVVNLCLPWK